MEEVGYLAELLARGRRPAPGEEEDITNLMQEGKRSKPATHCRRAPVEEDGGLGYYGCGGKMHSVENLEVFQPTPEGEIARGYLHGIPGDGGGERKQNHG